MNQSPFAYWDACSNARLRRIANDPNSGGNGSVASAILEERIAREKFERYVRKALEAAGPIAGEGDGNGGSLAARFYELMSELGIYRAPQKCREPVRKKLSHSKRMAVFERDGFKCKLCGRQKNLTIDHVQPFSKGGGDDRENLQTLCLSCNISKGAKVNLP